MNSNEEKKIINKLTNNLKSELFHEIHGKILKNISMISENFSKNVIKNLSWKIEEIQMPPNEIIYNINDNDHSLYILKSGEVELFFPGN